VKVPFLGLLCLGGSALWGQAEGFVFPTENRALLDGRPEDYFMYVNRNFEGEKSKPWQGGQYGLVRTPVRLGELVVYKRHHEGIDIRPVRRAPDGQPLDPILASAGGVVVHVSSAAGASNYGKYVVIEHVIDGSPYYTLYAHLASISVKPGQRVKVGEAIGRMGYTGRGLDRERAHLHYEICLRLSDRFQNWFEKYIKGSPNRHGEFNGMNLVGIDPTRFLVDSQVNPKLAITDYIKSGEPAFRVGVPQSSGLFILRAYPWLRDGQPSSAPAWALTFSATGVPLKAEALETSLTTPKLLWAKPGRVAYSYRTRGLLTGSPGSPRLSDSGKRFIELITGVE